VNLAAIALRRAEEQADSFRWEPEPRPVIRRPFQAEINQRRIKCVCGRCKRCKNRKAMRKWRAKCSGGKRVFHSDCIVCHRGRYVDDGFGWCARCQRQYMADYAAVLRSQFIDGGGI
jgi:hypothetical protein